MISYPAVGRYTIYCPRLGGAAYARIAFVRTSRLSERPSEDIMCATDIDVHRVLVRHLWAAQRHPTRDKWV